MRADDAGYHAKLGQLGSGIGRLQIWDMEENDLVVSRSDRKLLHTAQDHSDDDTFCR